MRCELSARQLSSSSNSLLHMVSRGVGKTCISGREKLLHAGFQACWWLRKPRPVEFPSGSFCLQIISLTKTILPMRSAACTVRRVQLLVGCASPYTERSELCHALCVCPESGALSPS
jgi:hypothetical protein